MILCNNLSKEYDGIQAISKVNIEIQKGESVALLGNNGAGKTTLINMLAGIVKPSSGSIHFGSADLPGPEIPENRALIGLVSEHSFLTPELSIKENLSFYAGLFHKSPDVNRTNMIIDQYGLTTRKNQKVSTLSRGWKQRASIARALIGTPEYILLDEPETGIDQATRSIIQKSLFSSQSDKVLVFATHNIDLAIEWCSKAIILNNGKIIREIPNISNSSKSTILEALN
jgi:ABC-type multidrug transport system ATPase subunit